ncbi:K+-transporting ATPase d chain [Listeria cornellensis FSL F6-0969]|uniref:K+-transporting ATPase d chain n=1 Tax=Listeria cornellensis FSL F6-0969 TaxID=1265820 RepID=W7BX15_9LIST|nr:K+-transporting ATPase d chain [Listeria cornellensis FSL F6-0969]
MKRTITAKFFSVITDVAKKHHITQIILGQSVKTRLEELTKGSVVNAIMRETDGIDIHIVADSRKKLKKTGWICQIWRIHPVF